MTKKYYLQRLFDVLAPDFDFVVGLQILLRKDVLDSESMDVIFRVFSEELRRFTDVREKTKLERSIALLRKINEAEMEASDVESGKLDTLFDEIY